MLEEKQLCDICKKEKPLIDFIDLVLRPHRGRKLNVMEQQKDVYRFRMLKRARLLVPGQDYPSVCKTCAASSVFANC